MSRKKLTSKTTFYLNRTHFIEVAKRATEWDFNRQISLDWATKLPQGQDFPIQMSFEHNHRRFEPCEPHTRLVIETPNCTAVVDVTNEFFATLPVASMIFDGDDIMFAIFPDADGNPLELVYLDLTRQTRRAMRKYAKKAKDERLSQLVERTLANAA